MNIDLGRVLFFSLSPNVTGSEWIGFGVEKEEETIIVVVPLSWVGFALYNIRNFDRIAELTFKDDWLELVTNRQVLSDLLCPSKSTSPW